MFCTFVINRGRRPGLPSFNRLCSTLPTGQYLSLFVVLAVLIITPRFSGEDQAGGVGGRASRQTPFECALISIESNL